MKVQTMVGKKQIIEAQSINKLIKKLADSTFFSKEVSEYMQKTKHFAKIWNGSNLSTKDEVDFFFSLVRNNFIKIVKG